MKKNIMKDETKERKKLYNIQFQKRKQRREREREKGIRIDTVHTWKGRKEKEGVYEEKYTARVEVAEKVKKKKKMIKGMQVEVKDRRKRERKKEEREREREKKKREKERERLQRRWTARQGKNIFEFDQRENTEASGERKGKSVKKRKKESRL